MNKVNLLFDINKLVLRPIPDQRAFEMEYFEFLTRLPDLIDQALQLTHSEMKRKRPLSINRNWFANTMNGNLLALVGQEYPNYLQKTKRGSFCLLMNFRYEGYLKKLIGKKLFPSYNHSKSSKALTNQRGLPKEEPLPVIYIGWSINKTNDRITGYHAVCIKGDERIWRTDLKAIEPPEVKGIEKDTTQPVAPTVTVKVKDQKKAK